MTKYKITYYIFFLIGISLFNFSCKKSKEFTKNHLDFSIDTLLFDTIFNKIVSTSK